LDLPQGTKIKETLSVELYKNNMVRYIPTFILDADGKIYIAIISLGWEVFHLDITNIHLKLGPVTHLEVLNLFTLEKKLLKIFTSTGELFLLDISRLNKYSASVDSSTTEEEYTTRVRQFFIQFVDDFNDLEPIKIPFKQIADVSKSGYLIMLDEDDNLFYSLVDYYENVEEIYKDKVPFILKEDEVVKDFVSKNYGIVWTFETPRFIPYFYYLLSLMKKEVREDKIEGRYIHYRLRNSSKTYIAPLPGK
jgi:hypothetical protein